MKLETLNQLPESEFLREIGGPLEGEIWLAARVTAQRPFPDAQALIAAFKAVMQVATPDEKIRLMQSHPPLAVAQAMSTTSIKEQSSAGLNQLTPEEFTEFRQLNDSYSARFGFPFVICVREHTKDSILTHFRQRLTHTLEQEIENGAVEVFKILRLRLLDLLNVE
ncbi:MAG: 2-oxo-4-hydroxy-4-carboxy-5-ureidoimidazoline decarboxylase [Chloroflexi bacterium AL-W]|nr:2-oxo-4-hydroxy-4-carboxy-5-ureidoimidazoline decarboxylase [Chloroflexi bacterium AL-W]